MSRANFARNKNANWLNIRVSSNKAETIEYFKSMGLLLIFLCLHVCLYARTQTRERSSGEWVTMRKFARHDAHAHTHNRKNNNNKQMVNFQFHRCFNCGSELAKQATKWMNFRRTEQSICSCITSGISSSVCVFVFFPISISISYFHSHSYSSLSPYFDLFMRVCEVRLLPPYHHRTHIVLNILKNVSRSHSNKSIKIPRCDGGWHERSDDRATCEWVSEMRLDEM